MTFKCPCCGRTDAHKDNTATDTMFFPVGGNDRDLVFCVACMNVVSGPPGEDGCLALPSDERLAAQLTAIQQTAKHIRDAAQSVNKRAKPKPHKDPGEGYNVRENGAIEFCFKKTRTEKFVMNMVKVTLDKLGFANAHQTGGSSRLCRHECPSKKGYQHVLVKIVAVEVEAEDDGRSCDAMPQ